MKHLFLFAVIGFLTIASTANAQKMMLGVRGGVNLATQHYDNLPDGETISSRTLGLGGAQLDYDFSKTWALGIQVLYDQKGAHNFTEKSSPNEYASIADWATTYLEVPLVAKLSFGSARVRPYLFGGPSIGFLLSNTETFEDNGSIAGYSVSVADSTNGMELSFIGGGGISYALSQLDFFIEAGYSYGLSSISTSNVYSFGRTRTNVYSRDIRLAAGILFPIR